MLKMILWCSRTKLNNVYVVRLFVCFICCSFVPVFSSVSDRQLMYVVFYMCMQYMYDTYTVGQKNVPL